MKKVEEGVRVELLGARCSRWLNRAARQWSVMEDGVALEGSQGWRGRKHCLLHLAIYMNEPGPFVYAPYRVFLKSI